MSGSQIVPVPPLIIPMPSMANRVPGWIELPMCVVDIHSFVAAQNHLKSLFQYESFLPQLGAEYSFSHTPSLLGADL